MLLDQLFVWTTRPLPVVITLISIQQVILIGSSNTRSASLVVCFYVFSASFLTRLFSKVLKVENENVRYLFIKQDFFKKKDKRNIGFSLKVVPDSPAYVQKCFIF